MSEKYFATIQNQALAEQGVRHEVAPLFLELGEGLFVCSKGGTMNILIFFLCISLIANLLLVRALIKLRRYIGSFTRLVEGMTIAIEPMINLKGDEVKVMSDGWTTKTVSGSMSAHFEHTIAITKNGPVILTVR